MSGHSITDRIEAVLSAHVQTISCPSEFGLDALVICDAINDEEIPAIVTEIMDLLRSKTYYEIPE